MTISFSEPWMERQVRARLIWRDMTEAEKASVEPTWQRGFRAWPEGSNPYQIDQDVWRWAAFEMGWQEAERLNR